MTSTRRDLIRAAALVAFALMLVTSCARTKPTDSDIVRAAIQRAVGESCNIITPSIGVETESANHDGSWTFNLRYQCAGLIEGSKKHQMILRLSPSKDRAGHLVWQAA